MKQWSPQALALQASWTSQMTLLSQRMVRMADHVLEHEQSGGGDPYQRDHKWSPTAYSLLFNDGSLMVFAGEDWTTSGEKATWPEAEIYGELVAEHGDEDDECLLCISIWCYVLSMADPIKYQPIVTKLMDIMVNGL